MLTIKHASNVATYLDVIGKAGEEQWFIQSWYEGDVIATQWEDGDALTLDELLMSHYTEIELFCCSSTLAKVTGLKRLREEICYTFLTLMLVIRCSRQPNSESMYRFEELIGRKLDDPFNFTQPEASFRFNLRKGEFSLIV